MNAIRIPLPATEIPMAFAVTHHSPLPQRRALELAGRAMEQLHPTTESRFTSAGHRDGDYVGFLELGREITRGGGPYDYQLYAAITSAACFVRRHDEWRLDWMILSSWQWANACWANWTARFGTFEIESKNLAAIEEWWMPLTAWSGLIQQVGNRWRAQIELPHAWDKHALALARKRDRN